MIVGTTQAAKILNISTALGARSLASYAERRIRARRRRRL